MEAIEANKDNLSEENSSEFMATETVLYSLHNNIWYELVYSKEFLMLDKTDIIYITLSDQLSNWRIRLKFGVFRSENTETIDTIFEKDGSITLNFTGNWGYGEIENNKPIALESKHGNQKLLLKFRSNASQGSNKRLLNISIWKFHQINKTPATK